MKAAIITGGTKGLGKELSLAFGSAGYWVLAIYHADQEAARRLAKAFTSRKIKGQTLKRDIAQASPPFEIVEKAEKLALIHSAVAPFEPMPLHLLSWEDFDAQMNVALRGSVTMTHALLPSLLKKSGVIVNILSKAVEDQPPKGFAAYTCAKYALLGLSLSLEAEYASRGLRVLTVSPGFMNTPLTKAWKPQFKSSKPDDPQDVASRILKQVIEIHGP